MAYFNNQILKILNEIDPGNIPQHEFDEFVKFIKSIVDDKDQIFKLYTIFGIKKGDTNALLQTIVNIANEKNISLNNFKTWLSDGVFELDNKIIRKLGSIFKSTVADKVGATGFDRLAQTVSDNFNKEEFTKLVNSISDSKQYKFTTMSSTIKNFTADTFSEWFPKITSVITSPSGKKASLIVGAIGASYWGFNSMFTSSSKVDPKIVEQANKLTEMIEQRNTKHALDIISSSEINNPEVVDTLNDNKIQVISFFDFVSAKFGSWGFGTLWQQIKDFAEENNKLMIVILMLGALGIIYRHSRNKSNVIR